MSFASVPAVASTRPAEEGTARLARRNAALRARAAEVPALRTRRRFEHIEERSRSFTFPFQCWPTFLDRETLRHWEAQAVALEALIKSVPGRLFDEDPARIARFYAIGSDALATVMLAPPNGIDAALSRLDLIPTSEGLRCIELNTGSYLGGWALSTVEEAYRGEPQLGEFFATGDPQTRDTPRAMLRHILGRLATAPFAVGARRLDVGNLYSPGGLEETLQRVTGERLNRAAREAAESLGLDLPCAFHGVTPDELELRDGKLFARGIRLHAVIEQHDDLTGRDLFRCFKTGELHLYTGPATAVISDKRNLALLYELRDSPIFTAAERDLIEGWIPWTHIVGRVEVEYRGRSVYLPELLRSHRTELVLKPALASSGVEVYLGRVTPEERWQEVVDRALQGNRWVVQELLHQPPTAYQWGDDEVAEQEVVWGLFVFGGEPGGGYLRMSRTGGGPLNVGQGAQVGLYFALDEAAS